MTSGRGRHDGNQGRTDRHEAGQAKARGPAESLSGARDRDEAEGHRSGKD